MKDSLFLAIDQGGHASRAIAFDMAGRAVAQAVEEVGVAFRDEVRVEQDPVAMVASVRAALAAVMTQLGSEVRRVRGAGLATQRSSIVCWDRLDGTPLSPILSWQDRRMASWLSSLTMDVKRVHDKTGLFPNAHYGASKLRWCLDELPGVATAQREGRLVCGPMASYLAYQLCRERPTLVDPANASRTLLWNRHHLDWDDELLALFGVPRSVLPSCVASRHHYGEVPWQGGSVALEVVTGDQSAALFAYGEPDPCAVYVNVGTGAFVQRCLGMSPPHTDRLLASVVYQRCGDALYALEGTVNGAGSALAEVERELGVDQREAEREGPRWLEEYQDPPLFLNGISGLGAPFWVADFSSRFVGEGTPAAKVVAVIESIVFLIVENIVEMARYLPRPERVVISGGLAQLNGLCQRLADVSRLPVHRPQACEATARGLAYLLAGRPASWPDSGPPDRFQPSAAPDLIRRYRTWRDLMFNAVQRTSDRD